MVIKVLGSGCANCKKVEALARSVVSELGVEAAVERVADFKAIAGYGAFATPGLVIDEKVVSAGRVPSKVEVTSWITTALASAK